MLPIRAMKRLLRRLAIRELAATRILILRKTLRRSLKKSLKGIIRGSLRRSLRRLCVFAVIGKSRKLGFHCSIMERWRSSETRI
jgi:hypothetical protein